METMDALQRMLDSAGMSRYELSKRMGKSTGYVQSAMERGRDMTAQNLARMAKILGYRLLLVGRGNELEIGGEDADNHQGPADQRGDQAQAEG